MRVAGVTALHYQELLPSGNFAVLLDEKTTQAQRQAFRIVGGVIVGTRPALITRIPGTSRLLVANNGTGTVSVVDMTTLQQIVSVPTGLGPHGVAASLDGRFLLVANTRANTVTVIDATTFTIVAQVPVGGFPTDVIVLPSLS